MVKLVPKFRELRQWKSRCLVDSWSRYQNIWLDNAPISKVICVVGPESDEKAIDQFDVARKKHFSLLGKAMIDWTEYLSSRLYSLSDLYYLMASPEIPTVTQHSGSSCKTLSSMDFQECNINTQLSFELSRRFLEENRKKNFWSR